MAAVDSSQAERVALADELAAFWSRRGLTTRFTLWPRCFNEIRAGSPRSSLRSSDEQAGGPSSASRQPGRYEEERKCRDLAREKLSPPRKGKVEVAVENKRAKTGWDKIPDEDFLREQLRVHRQLTSMNIPVPRKRRECYVGNLLQGKVTEGILRNTLRKLFHALPQYAEEYPGMPDPVCTMFFPPQGKGQFAFVEFLDEVLAETALLMSGVDLFGRPMKIGRPVGYVKSLQEALPLDVRALRGVGVLPSLNMFGKPAALADLSRERELYIGNLLAGEVSPAVITNLLLPVCLEMPEYDPTQGQPITKVNMVPDSTFCFVQFQSIEMATSALVVFDNTELFGRRLRVRRPTQFVGGGGCSAAPQGFVVEAPLQHADASQAPAAAPLPPPPPLLL